MNLKTATTSAAIGIALVGGTAVGVDQLTPVINLTCDVANQAPLSSIEDTLDRGKVRVGFVDFRPLTSVERADLKACEGAKALSKRTFVRGDYRIQVVDFGKIDGGIQVFARIWQKNAQIGFGEDGTVDIERFRIFNPPVLVPDGTKTLLSACDKTSSTSSLCKDTYADNYRQDPQEAILLTLINAVSTGKHHPTGHIQKNKVGRTTSVFYTDAGSGGTVNTDGYAVSNGKSSFSAACADAGGSTDGNSTGVENYIRVRNVNNATGRSCFRTFFVFDTTTLSGSTVDSATLSLWGTGVVQDFTGPTYAVYGGTLANNNEIVASDFSGTIGNTTAFSSTFTSGTWTSGAYNNISLNSSGIAYIDTNSKTIIGLRNANYDVAGGTPAGFGNNSVQGYFADRTGTTNDPFLTVESTASAVNDYSQHIIMFE